MIRTENLKDNTILRFFIDGLATIAALLFGLLSLFVIPAPDTHTEKEISGNWVYISRPLPEYGDIGIVLENEQGHYINRANEVTQFDWEIMISEIQSGEEIYLTIVTPLFWRLFNDDLKTNQTVAGVRSGNIVNMDPNISAITRTAQGKFSKIAIFASSILMICVLPDFVHLLRQYKPLITI